MSASGTRPCFSQRNQENVIIKKTPMLFIAQASVSLDRACMTLALCTHTAHDVSVQQLDSLLWPCLQPKETLALAVSQRAPWERPEIGVTATNVKMALAIRHVKLGCSMTRGMQHLKENEMSRQCSLDADCPRRTPSKCAAGSSFGISLTG